MQHPAQMQSVTECICCRLMHNHPLASMGLAVVAQSPHIQTLDIDYSRLTTFLLAAEALYTSAPYHNARHATHVLWATHKLLHMTPLLSLLDPIAVLATYVAAICHDMGHRYVQSWPVRRHYRDALLT